MNLHGVLSLSASVLAVSCTKTGQHGERTKRAIGGRRVTEKQFEGLQLGDDLENIPLRLFWSGTRNLTEMEGLSTSY